VILPVELFHAPCAAAKKPLQEKTTGGGNNQQLPPLKLPEKPELFFDGDGSS